MKWLIRVVLLMILLAAGFVGLSLYQFQAVRDYSDTPIIIASGTGTRAILNQLYAAGLTPHPFLLMLPVALDGFKGAPPLKAGEYQFEVGLTAEQVLAKVRAGKVVIHKITIPEGLTVFQIRALLLKEPALSGEVEDAISEGTLLPETYQFTRGDSRNALIQRMRSAQKALLEEAWNDRSPAFPLASPYEALILASIVEKETRLPAERGVIAGVYLNRLRIGMLLQADPTVAYGVIMTEGVGADPELPVQAPPLTRGDLERDTPYNTYIHTGLPPTPIACAGAASIRATLHPEATDALYFVATGGGGHAFARTLAEHNLNVAAYRRALKQHAQ
jgi:UPF0755 protein